YCYRRADWSGLSFRLLQNPNLQPPASTAQSQTEEVGNNKSFIACCRTERAKSPDALHKTPAV
uniref:Uncharacterized protein n=1 Tax=Gouania willdenowi TaxID=441366 RepID=A0A8C5D3T5_GOUWI